MTPSNPDSVNHRPRVFISYKRNSDPDGRVVKHVVKSLEEHCEVLIDRDIPVGATWSEWITSSIQHSDYFIVFLTATSLQSEAVADEILQAAKYKSAQRGKPKILPIKLGPAIDPYQIAYNIGMVLRPIQWAEWFSDDDTPGLIDKLLGAIKGEALPLSSKELNLVPAISTSGSLIPAPALSGHTLRWKEGAVSPDSYLYVERADDRVILDAIEHEGGDTVTIKGPRKTGKSSLLARAMQRAGKLGMRQVWLDMDSIDETERAESRLFYKRFCDLIIEHLQEERDLDFLENRVEEYWAKPDSNVVLCTRYIKQNILRPLRDRTEKNALVLALDNVDRLANCNFRSDFFGMLRSWHNERAQPNSPWKQVYILVATSTEPLGFISNLNFSPFNVGEQIELDDFTDAQMVVLNERHGKPFHPPQLEQLMKLLGGQPYLTRRAFYLVASGQISAEGLFVESTKDRGPFGDYMRSYLLRLRGQDDLIKALREIIYEHDTKDESAAFRLEGIGLIRKSGRREEMRCQLYEKFFGEHL